jgi:integrase
VHLKRSTITRDRGYLERYLVPAFGARPIGDITADDVRGFIAELSDRGLKPATVEKAGQILSKILAQAVSDHRIAANPCAGIRFPRAGKPTTKALEAWQVHDLADAIDPRYRLLVLLDCWTGLRIGEVVALTIGDIDVVRRRVTVSKSMTETEGYLELGTTKTDAGVRVVPLPSWLAEELGPYLEGKHPGDIAFPAPRGGFLRLGNWRSKQWRAATRAIGEPTLRIHDMRHTAITLWLEGGTDPVTIARWAGHESVVTVLNRYAHARADATMDHLDAMGRRRGSGATITRLR